MVLKCITVAMCSITGGGDVVVPVDTGSLTQHQYEPILSFWLLFTAYAGNMFIPLCENSLIKDV